MADSDQEQKESSGTKKFGEDEKVRPEFFQFQLPAQAALNSHQRAAFIEDDCCLSAAHCLVLTPPPERS